ncbi:hypothetical protein L332_07375 [Agrococcus pavilionensis RW1]|uniref:Uncharacterized protein n=1 Tax=Agrococcus pavilionensis RW1 TaxID=1330458 RepID=U1LQG6_9MICO|nr:hypothetical protein [Agrococcus pavilionensis]ERG64272.1 hypothetical protein L332_07375 [Agrococcus pavilionensis RW1]
MPELANGKYVSQADAIRQWWPAARDALIETAGEYGAWLSFEALSGRVQARTGITTNQPPEEWIPRVLGAVATDAERRGEPRLTSLCVTAERRVAEDYAGVPAGTDAPTRERVAAADRLECYRAFGATMPDDGGAPTLLAPLPASTARPARAERPARTRAAAPKAASAPSGMRETTCPHCFMVVPVAPTCRDCGEPLAL